MRGEALNFVLKTIKKWKKVFDKCNGTHLGVCKQDFAKKTQWVVSDAEVSFTL